MDAADGFLPSPLGAAGPCCREKQPWQKQGSLRQPSARLRSLIKSLAAFRSCGWHLALPCRLARCSAGVTLADIWPPKFQVAGIALDITMNSTNSKSRLEEDSLVFFPHPFFFFFLASLWGRVLLFLQSGHPNSGPAMPRAMLSGGTRLQDAARGWWQAGLAGAERPADVFSQNAKSKHRKP